jgi:preprotein translocase subunit SecF
MALLSFGYNFNIPFMRYKAMAFVIFLAICGATLGGYFKMGLNWGIDFKGGVAIEAQMSHEPVLNTLRSAVQKALQGQDVSIQEVGPKGSHTLLLRMEKKGETEPLLQALKEVLGQDVIFRKVDVMGAKLGQELLTNSLWAVMWTLFAIMIYVWLRFEWSFGVCALIALFQDCLVVLLFFILTQKEFNEGAIVALLITASYSVNDTVIIFDRLRENRGYRKGLAWEEMINLSINETLTRTLLTSYTTLLALSVLYLFGGEVIASYSLPLIVGIGAGTISSIVTSAPLLAWFPSLGRKQKPSSKKMSA